MSEATPDPTVIELLSLNQQLLDSISQADWETYKSLCDPSLTCFEPESCGHLVEGLEFHKFYFDLGGPEGPRTTTMASPHVRLLGAAAVVSYVRLVQRLDGSKQPVTTQVQETRVWRLEGGRWRHVHFHRSFHV